MTNLLWRLWRALFIVAAMSWLDIMPSADWLDWRVSACRVFYLVMAVSCIVIAFREDEI